MRPAEELLTELGISDPADIELEAIAYCVGVEVEYRRLAGCEAQIIGYKDRAVVYVSPDTSPHRKRFSTGHELGHWHHHRGHSFVCRSSISADRSTRNRRTPSVRRTPTQAT